MNIKSTCFPDETLSFNEWQAHIKNQLNPKHHDNKNCTRDRNRTFFFRDADNDMPHIDASINGRGGTIDKRN